MTHPRERQDTLPHDHRRARRPQTDRRLRRSRHAIIGGVASGIAAFVDVAPRTVRWLFGVSLPLTLGLSGVAYLLLWMLLPGPTRDSEDRSDQG